MCNNKNCKAYQQIVLVTKGFGNFNISVHIYECVCPSCKNETEPAFNIYYYKTKLTIKAKKANEKKFTKQFIADNDQWHSFLSGNGEMAKWNFMEINAEKLSNK